MKKIVGSTFIEILVSLILFAILLFGLDALQINALKTAKKAYYLTIASQQLRNINDILSLKPALNSALLTNWNKQNSELLPNGQGKIEERTTKFIVSLSFGKLLKPCLQNKVGISTCLQLIIQKG